MRVGRAGAAVGTVALVPPADQRAHGGALLAPLDHTRCPLPGGRVDDLAWPTHDGGDGAARGLDAGHAGNGPLLGPRGEGEEGSDVLGGAEPAVAAGGGVELHQLVRVARRHERLPVLLLVLDDDEAVVERVERQHLGVGPAAWLVEAAEVLDARRLLLGARYAGVERVRLGLRQGGRAVRHAHVAPRRVLTDATIEELAETDRAEEEIRRQEGHRNATPAQDEILPRGFLRRRARTAEAGADGTGHEVVDLRLLDHVLRAAQQEVRAFAREPVLGRRGGLGRAAGLAARAVRVVEAARLPARADVTE